jgi:hypothetical protein
MLHSGHWSATRPVPVEELFRGGVGDPDGGGGIELARVPDPLTGMRSHPHAGHRARTPGAAFNFCPQPPQAKISSAIPPNPHAGHWTRAPGAAFNFCPQPSQVKVSFITEPGSSRLAGTLVGGAHGRAELGFPQGESRAARGRGSDVEGTFSPTRSAPRSARPIDKELGLAGTRSPFPARERRQISDPLD